MLLKKFWHVSYSQKRKPDDVFGCAHKVCVKCYGEIFVKRRKEFAVVEAYLLADIKSNLVHAFRHVSGIWERGEDPGEGANYSILHTFKIKIL